MKRLTTTLVIPVVAITAMVVLHGVSTTAEGQPPAAAQAGPPAQAGQGRPGAPAPDQTKPQASRTPVGRRWVQSKPAAHICRP